MTEQLCIVPLCLNLPERMDGKYAKLCSEHRSDSARRRARDFIMLATYGQVNHKDDLYRRIHEL